MTPENKEEKDFLQMIRDAEKMMDGDEEILSEDSPVTQMVLDNGSIIDVVFEPDAANDLISSFMFS